MDLYTYTGTNKSTRVWYWDGTVTYSDQLHVIITVISTLTAGVLVIPYFTTGVVVLVSISSYVSIHLTVSLVQLQFP